MPTSPTSSSEGERPPLCPGPLARALTWSYFVCTSMLLPQFGVKYLEQENPLTESSSYNHSASQNSCSKVRPLCFHGQRLLRLQPAACSRSERGPSPSQVPHSLGCTDLVLGLGLEPTLNKILDRVLIQWADPCVFLCCATRVKSATQDVRLRQNRASERSADWNFITPPQPSHSSATCNICAVDVKQIFFSGQYHTVRQVCEAALWHLGG